jgi:hypothetical protein
MNIEPTISVGDLCIFVGMCGAAVGNYFGTVNKVKEVKWMVEELRRGRGLILRDWPPMVKRCFGYRNGND